MGAWHIMAKDLRLLLRDRRALFLLLALPMVFISILGVSTGQLLGWQSENQVLKVAVVNLDEGEFGDEVIQSLKQREGVRVVLAPTAIAARGMVDRKDVTAALILGPDFHNRVDDLTVADLLDPQHGKLAAGLGALDVQVEQQVLFESVGAIVRQLILAEAMRVLTPHIVRRNRLAAQWIDRVVRNQEEEQAANATSPPQEPSPPPESSLPAQKRPVAQRGGVYETLVPAYTVMFVFFLLHIMARSFLSERNLGTLRRLRLAPVPSTAILVGKTLPFFVLSLVQSALLFLSGRLLFGMTWGTQPWLLLPVMLCTSLAATTLGLLTATLVKTDSQVDAYATFLVITMAAISGVFMPRAWLPWMMQEISLGTPHAWALIAYDELLFREVIDLRVIRNCCLALVGFSAAFFLCGWWRFRTLD